jgi:hypothetical protein
MPQPYDFTGKRISFTYDRLLQIDPSGNVYDGLGNPVSIGDYEFYYQSTPPFPNPSTPGARWLDSNSGIEYVWIFDGDNYLWMQPTDTAAIQTPVEEIIYVSLNSSPADISAGFKEYRQVGYNCIVKEWSVVSAQTGSIEFDVKASSFASFPTVTSIVGLDPPKLAAQEKNSNLSPTLWSSLSANQLLEISVTSCTGIQTVGLFIKIQKTL